MAIILCYHELSEVESNPWTLTPQTLRRQFRILRDRGYRAMPLDEMVADVPPNGRTVAITFDDGRAGCRRYAAGTLAEFKFPATFYVCPGFVDSDSIPAHEDYSQFLTWADIRKLAEAGHAIGSHAVTHRNFRELTDLERREELVFSKRLIEDHIDGPCVHFAAPYGFVDSSTCQMAAQAGYKSVVTTVFGSNKPPLAHFLLKRWEITSPCLEDEFVQTLEHLEHDLNQYRVLIADRESVRSDENFAAVERAAEFDFVIAPDIATHDWLTRQGLRSWLPDGIDEQATSGVSAHVLQQTPELLVGVKQCWNLPADSQIVFEGMKAAIS